MNRPMVLALALTLLAGCSSSGLNPPAPLNSSNINLIFVVSEDLAYNAPGDIDPNTANLTNQGLQRSLLMATFLQERVLGKKNVTGIYALEPMTHLQTANNYPDMVALWTIQQFALLNQISMSTGSQDSTPFAGNSYPINASYTPGSMPSGVAAPSPSLPCSDCQGLDFNNEGSSNEALVTGIIAANIPGFYVFSAPWETISELLASINKSGSYNLAVPSGYSGPNHIHAITITPSGIASLVTFDSSLNPLATYPALPSQLPPVGTTESWKIKRDRRPTRLRTPITKAAMAMPLAP